jgi:hypothetical protein
MARRRPRRQENDSGNGSRPYGIDSRLVLSAIVSVAVAYPLMRSMFYGTHWIDLPLAGEYIVTLFTALWFWFRYHFTHFETARVKGVQSLMTTFAIMFIGLSCFPFSGTRVWFVTFPITLLLGTLKDLEVMTYHKRIIDHTTPVSRRRWKSRFLVCQECYNIVRDVSMALWWTIYGVLITHHQVSHDIAILLFGAPYTLCVLAWSAIKITMHNIEC